MFTLRMHRFYLAALCCTFASCAWAQPKPPSEKPRANSGKDLPNTTNSTYYFKLESFEVEKIRSLRTDTDTVTFSIMVADKVFGPVTAKIDPVKQPDNPEMPSHEYTLGPEFQFGPVTAITDKTPVVVRYMILNSGHATDKDVRSAAEAVFSGAVAKLAVTNPWTAVIALLKTPAFNVIFADCDGVVAQADITLANAAGPVVGPLKKSSGDNIRTLTGRTLKAWLPDDGAKAFSDPHLGTDSPSGCAVNSKYEVNWSIRKAAASPR